MTADAKCKQVILKLGDTFTFEEQVKGRNVLSQDKSLEMYHLLFKGVPSKHRTVQDTVTYNTQQ